jgi:hypothetical protein
LKYGLEECLRIAFQVASIDEYKYTLVSGKHCLSVEKIIEELEGVKAIVVRKI